jgi:hypothetical protein
LVGGWRGPQKLEHEPENDYEAQWRVSTWQYQDITIDYLRSSGRGTTAFLWTNTDYDKGRHILVYTEEGKNRANGYWVAHPKKALSVVASRTTLPTKTY